MLGCLIWEGEGQRGGAMCDQGRRRQWWPRRVVLGAGEAEARLSGARSREGRGRSFAAKQMSGRRAGQGRGTGVAVADRPWHRGERQHLQGAWRARGRQQGVVPCKPGARERFGAGARRVGGQVAAPAYGRHRRRGEGRREVGEAVSGSFVIFSKSKN